MAQAAKLHQGDIVRVPFPFADLSGKKVRPALIVSAEPQGSELIVAFITSVLTNRSPRGAEVVISGTDPEFGVTGLKVDSLIRLDKLITLSTGLIARRLVATGPGARARVASMLRRAFDLK